MQYYSALFMLLLQVFKMTQVLVVQSVRIQPQHITGQKHSYLTCLRTSTNLKLGILEAAPRVSFWHLRNSS